MTTFDRAIEALERRAWQDGLEVSNGAPLVRAVLLAIREPDEGMVAAPIARKLSVDFSPTFVWQKMIDAILKEQP